MKRVLQIPSGLYGSGEQKVSVDIGLYTDPKKYEVHYVVFTEKVDLYEEELLRAGCTVIHLPISGIKPLYYIRLYRGLRNLMQKNRYDVVHSHTMFQSGIAMLAAKRAGVPIRISHSHNTGKQKRLFSGVYDRIMRRMILHNATQLLACGEAAGRFLFGEKAFTARGRLIRNGIETERYRFSEDTRRRIRSELNLDEAFIIGNVARLSKAKNQTYLIELLPSILKEKPNAVLLLLGEGNERKQLELQVQNLGLQNKVFFLGWIDNVEDYLNAMDVLALPSLFEGMSLSVLEAQANGMPCVISENVPADVIMTDLIQVIPLQQFEEWAKTIDNNKRVRDERELKEIKDLVNDKDNMLQNIYRCYNQTHRSSE